MDDKERIRELEEKIDLLQKEKHAVLDAINLAANLSNFRISLNKIEQPMLVIQETNERIRRILDFKVTAFYLVSETDSDFQMVLADPTDAIPQLDKELNALIDDKSFAWALRRNKPVIVSSISKSERIILHSMNTSSRTRGIFVGILSSSENEILDLHLFLFSITIIACSNGLESFELYRQIKSQNLNLEESLSKLEESRRQLEEEENKYHALFSQSTNAIVLYDLATRLPVDFNSLAHENLGYTREEFQRRRIEENSELSIGEIKKRIKKITQIGPGAMETRQRRKDGTLRDIIVNARAIGIGGKTYLLTLFNDVTEQKRSEAERMQLERQLQQAQKMEAIGTLAGGIAHDFNNILGVIQGYGDLCMMDLAPSQENTRQNVESLLKAVERAKDLVSQILTFSRQSEDKPQSINLNYIVAEILKLLRATLPATIEICSSIPGEQLLIEAVPTHIHQVIMNLCTNALHAMKQKYGQLEIRLSSILIEPGQEPGPLPETAADDQSEEDVVIHTFNTDLPPGLYVQMTISDTGHGIAASVMERIFDPYFTTKEPGEGTGLGLSVVHGIVKRYGGSITVTSVLERGTVVNIRFPAVVEVGKPAYSPLESLPTGVETILLVDDERELLSANRQILERLHYNVVSASDSTEALGWFREDPQNFDLLLTDMTMPKMTGMELTREILKTRPDLPVILCTGFCEYIDAREVKELGIKEYLMKPVNRHNLATTVRRALDHEEPLDDFPTNNED